MRYDGGIRQRCVAAAEGGATTRWRQACETHAVNFCSASRLISAERGNRGSTRKRDQSDASARGSREQLPEDSPEHGPGAGRHVFTRPAIRRRIDARGVLERHQAAEQQHDGSQREHNGEEDQSNGGAVPKIQYENSRQFQTDGVARIPPTSARSSCSARKNRPTGAARA